MQRFSEGVSQHAARLELFEVVTVMEASQPIIATTLGDHHYSTDDLNKTY